MMKMDDKMLDVILITRAETAEKKLAIAVVSLDTIRDYAINIGDKELFDAVNEALERIKGE